MGKLATALNSTAFLIRPSGSIATTSSGGDSEASSYSSQDQLKQAGSMSFEMPLLDPRIDDGD